MHHDLKPDRITRIVLTCGVSAIVVGLALVLATVNPGLPLLAGGVAMVTVGGALWWQRRR